MADAMDKRLEKGQILKSAREAKGLSLDTVHQATKIPMDILRAIEEGYSVRTLSPFYYRGFVKMYARYLEVDVSSVIEDYQPEKLPVHVASQTPRKSISETAFSWLTPAVTETIFKFIKILLIILVIFVFFKITKSFFHRKSGLNAKSKTTEGITRAAGIKEKKKGPAVKSKTPEPKDSQKANEEKSLTINAVTAQANQPSAAGNQNAPAHAENKSVRLSVRAKRDLWLEVKSDGQAVFRSTLKKGVMETWLANREIELSGRNINDLELELNGKMIGSLGKGDHRVKKVVIDPNGFSVKQ